MAKKRTEKPTAGRFMNKPEKIDVSKALKMYLAGVPQVDIARALGVTKQSVNNSLKPFRVKHPEAVASYEQNKAELISAKEMEALEALTDEKLNNASARDIATVYGILTDKQRLAAGKSTANINVFSRLIVATDEADLKDDRTKK